MPGPQYLQFRNAVDNPRSLKKRTRAEIAAEIARVDAAINDFLQREQPAPGDTFRVLADVSVPIALRSLRKYRNRLARQA